MEKLEIKKVGTSRKRKAVQNKEVTTNKKRKTNKPKKKVPKNKVIANEIPKKSNISKKESYEKNKDIKNVKNVKTKKNHKEKKTNKIKIALAFVIIGIVIVGIYLFCTLTYFNIESFEINGTEKYSVEEVAEKGNLKKGRNIFIQLLKGVSKNINELPYVKKASVKIVLPNKLKINVVERKPYFIAFDKDHNIFYKIDEEGYILEEGNITEKKEDELLTYGFIFDDETVLGTRLKEVDISKIEIYNNVKKEFESSKINGKITKVNFENSLTTITLNDKLNVIFPNDTDIKYKMSFFKNILEKIGEDSVGVIDMTKTDPVYSIF